MQSYTFSSWVLVDELTGYEFVTWQGNTTEELPERLLGAVRICHMELSSAIEPNLEPDPSE